MQNVTDIFQEGSFVPLPSQEAMAKTIGSGGNGVVAYIYHGGREFAVKETHLRQEELETWSSVSHPNVIELCAVIEGAQESLCLGARTCYQMMPRMTGEFLSEIFLGTLKSHSVVAWNSDFSTPAHEDLLHTYLFYQMRHT